VLCLAAVIAPVSPPVGGSTAKQKPGIGSTLSSWYRAYGVSRGPGDLCSAKDSCFGPGLRNSDSSGHTYQFTDVDTSKGIIGAYQEDFPNNTPLAEVEAAILRTLPPDVHLGNGVIDTNGGSCGLLTVSSPTLIKELNTPIVGDTTGTVGIELQHIDANLNSVYSPDNIQTVTVGLLAEDPTQAC
jgi:hypothetical protein